MTLSAATLAKRSPWLSQVEDATRAWRLMRAEQLEAESCLLETREHVAQSLDGTFLGVEEVDVWRNSPWHTDRAWAHRERFERLQNCGQRSRRERCACPGDSPGTRPAVIMCDHWRLCLTCKGRRAARYRARFTLGRQRALEQNEPRTRRFATGGVWSEKFITLTAPHMQVSRDVEALHVTWTNFRASLARYFKRTGVKKWREVPYWRSMEVTKSDGGHAHFHVWMLAPFLPKHLVRHYWGRSMPDDYRAELPVMQLALALADTDPRNHRELRKAAILDKRLRHLVLALERKARNAHERYTRAIGTTATGETQIALERAWHDASAEARQARDECSYIYAPITDVRKPSADIAAELVKYIVKDTFTDADGTQTPIDAETFASIYAATDGKRAVATSPHLVDDVEQEKRDPCCSECGVEREIVFVWMQPGPSNAVATPPPNASCAHLPIAA